MFSPLLSVALMAEVWERKTHLEIPGTMSTFGSEPGMDFNEINKGWQVVRLPVHGIDGPRRHSSSVRSALRGSSQWPRPPKHRNQGYQ